MGSPGFEGVRRSEASTDKRPEAVRVWLLGGFRVSVGSRTIKDDAWRLRKAAALVKLLALSSGHRLHREQVMDILWPDSGRQAASNSLRKTLHASRRTLSPDPAAGSRYLASEYESLVLCPNGEVWVDVDAFEEAAAAARRAKAPGAYRAAIDLYAGELLPEDRYETWGEARREELRRLYRSLLVELARLYEEREEYEPGVDLLRRAIAEELTLEEAHAGLMRLFALMGREGEALAQYEQLRKALSRELITEPSTKTRRLREEIVAGRLELSQPIGLSSEEPPDASRHNLPAPRTSFVGRDQEMVEIERALAMTRLLTITGAGGSGKTRLALEVARSLVGSYSDGVWLVELAPLTEGELVPQVVAEALGVREQPGRSLTDTLAEALRQRDMLLVLDNCEHLADPVARLLDTLLDSCPRLRVLATSRETLGVKGEAVRPVASLSVPDTDRLPAAEEMTRYDAVRLFLDRTRLRLPNFDLTPENARVVAQVCHGLEGMPLAIELASARVGTLSVEQISERLRDTLDLLSVGGRTAVPRQRTLRGALDWSYELLGEPERTLFARLSVFAGGWTLGAADVVGAGGGIEQEDVVNLLGDLVDKSLVVAETSEHGVLRYRMLEPIRQYARQRLETSGESDVVLHRHATFFLALAEEAEPELHGPQQVAWLEQLEVEYHNLRAALSWTLESGAAELALRLAGTLAVFWYRRGDVAEGRRWLETALTTGGNIPSKSTLGKVKTLAACLERVQGNYERSKALGEESLALYQVLGDDVGAAQALFELGTTSLFQMNTELAWSALEEAATLQRTSGDAVGLGRTLFMLGSVALARNDYNRTTALTEESLALSRKAGDETGVLFSLHVGTLASLGRGANQRVGIPLREGLKLSQRLKMRRLTAYHLHVAAALAGSQGQPVRAAQLWGAAEALRETLGATFSLFITTFTALLTLLLLVLSWAMRLGRQRLSRGRLCCWKRL